MTPADKMLYSVVKLELDCKKGKRWGTGFYSFYEKDGKTYPFIVTNRHVVEGCDKGSLVFQSSENGIPNPQNQFGVELIEMDSYWTFHPDPNVDVAVAPWMPVHETIRGMNKEAFLIPIDVSIIPTNEQAKSLDALERVVFIGFPIGLQDTVNLLPLFRQGITATPFFFDYNGRKCFLVDASVFPGSSGSPVFINDTMHFERNKGVIVGSRIHFIGILTLAFRNLIRGENTPRPVGSDTEKKNQEYVNIGLVFKPETILETCETFLKEKGLD